MCSIYSTNGLFSLNFEFIFGKCISHKSWGVTTSDFKKLSHAARTLEQLKVTEKVEEGSMNQEKRPAESSHSASQFSGKRFRDFRGIN